MNQAETAALLALANGHDQRHGLDDVKVQAWHALFAQEARDLDPGFAAGIVNQHYARSTDMLMPAHIVTAWRQHKIRDHSRRVLAARPGTPMPDYVREQVTALRSRRD